jgi:ligand-binding sensor domain-containing protein
VTQYVHEDWQSDRGLPENTVFAVAQTRDRCLWIGTYAGLARFDGIRFTVFDTTNTAAFRSQGISSLLEDADGTLWIGTRNGLVLYSHGSFRLLTSRDGLSGDHIMSLYRDRRGAVWIGTETGLTKYRNGIWVRYSTGDGLAHP